MLILLVPFCILNIVLGDEIADDKHRQPVPSQNHYQASDQLVQFANEHPNPIGILTTSWGKPVTTYEASDGLNLNDSIIHNHYLFESLSHLTRERLPPRAVHPNGAGAHGYFQVTHDISHITNVKFLNGVGKQTPLFMRFSPTTGEIGSPEIKERNKGIGMKFYTEEGNMDIAGFNINAFALKDPAYSNVFIHSLKPNPKTRLRDVNLGWDFIANVPSALHASIQTGSRGGQPRSYATMPGHALHTYQVENDAGEVSFIKFNWFPDAGIQNLTTAEVLAWQGIKPKYHTEELYNRIANGTYPTYTLCIQVIPFKDMEKVKYDIFDITMNWPVKEHPNIPVGKIVLNRNVDNYFAEVEQSAFNPGNLPPGIQGVDKIFEARIFIYREGHLNRLGSGFNNIPINQPKNKVLTYNRDGCPSLGNNGGGAPNYYPNSFHGPVPVTTKYKPRYRPDTDPGPTNYWQVAQYYYDLDDTDKQTLIGNIAASLSRVLPLVREKITKMFADVDKEMSEKIQNALAKLVS